MARLNNQRVIHEVYGTVGESWWTILGGKDGSYPREKRVLSQHNFMEYFESQSSSTTHARLHQWVNPMNYTVDCG